MSIPYVKYIGHVCHCPNTMTTKKMLFAKSRCPYQQVPWINITKLKHLKEHARRCTQHKSGFTALVDHVVVNATPQYCETWI